MAPAHAPAPRPTAPPEPAAVPTAASLPQRSRGEQSAAGAPDERPASFRVPPERFDCRDFVEIRNTRPTIDFDFDVVRVDGDVVVSKGRVRDVAVCIGGSCRAVAGGRQLEAGEVVPFSVSASRHRPTGLTVRCAGASGR